MSVSERLDRSHWWGALAVLGAAALVRLPHYDVAWFGYDQVKYMFEARRILAGHWDVSGPDASGLDIIGPLYSYVMAGVLSLRDTPAFLVLFGVGCDMLAAWFVYDIGRRLSGVTTGLAAAFTYVTLPMLVFGTRLVWNPTLLPLLVAIGWWLVHRYCESPSTAKFVAVAFVCGLTLPLHATGVFHAAGLMLAAIAARPPTLRQIGLAIVAGLLPLAPVIPRLFASGNDVGALGNRVTMPTDLLSLLRAVVDVPLNFPKAFGAHWSTQTSTAVMHIQAVAAIVGAVIGIARRGPFRAIWMGLVLSIAAQLVAATFYTAPVLWHHFIALSPALCLCIGQATVTVPRWRLVSAALIAVLAAAHVIFLEHVDRAAIASGLIRVETQHLGVHGAPGVGYGPTVRDVRAIGLAVQQVVPDGATAMLTAHGAQAELWREAGAEYLRPASAPQESWPTGFLVMGAGPTVLRPDARLVDGRVCAFEQTTTPWRVRHGAPPPGWEQPAFADGAWVAFPLPRRVAGPSLAGPGPPLAVWRATQTLLRGRFSAPVVPRRMAFGVVIHGTGFSSYWIAKAYINGAEIPITRGRVLLTSIGMTHEWFLDVPDRLQPGDNSIAFAIDGQVPSFDLDVFEIPCLDADWYR